MYPWEEQNAQRQKGNGVDCEVPFKDSVTAGGKAPTHLVKALALMVSTGHHISMPEF